MSNLPDFSKYDYNVIKQLGKNGDRYTYLAEKITTEKMVVIKESRNFSLFTRRFDTLCYS